MTTAATGNAVIEWAPFRVKAGVDERTVLDLSARLQEEFLQHQRGFIRRELLKGDDGQWVDIVWWADEESAQAIIPAVAGSPACQAYFELMVGADTSDPGSGVSHFRQLRRYE